MESKQKRALSIIDNLKVLNPCTENWDLMTPNDRGKHCLHCKKNVYDVSSMTRNETRLILALNRGSCCLRITKREDGSTVFKKPDWKVRLENEIRPLISTASALALSTFSLGASQAIIPDEVWGDNSRQKTEAIETPIVQTQSLKTTEQAVTHPSADSQNFKELNTIPTNERMQVFYGDVKIESTFAKVLTYIEGSFGALVMVMATFFGIIFGIVGLITKRKTVKILTVFCIILFFSALGLRWIVSAFFNVDAMIYY